MSLLSKLQESREKNLQGLQTKLSPNKNVDARFWKLKADKDLKGEAKIRFIPFIDANTGNTTAFVDLMEHYIKNQVGGIKQFHCLKKRGENCPVCAYGYSTYKQGKTNGDKALEKLGNESNKREAFISNIYVVDDKTNPENNGKVFLYRYSSQIAKKIESLLAPSIEDVESVNPWDVFANTDFWVKSFAKKLSETQSIPDYSESQFVTTSCFKKMDEDSIEAILTSAYSLEEFNIPSDITYDSTKEELDKHLNASQSGYGESHQSTPNQSEQVYKTPNSTQVADNFDSVVNGTVSDSEDDEIDLDSLLNQF